MGEKFSFAKIRTFYKRHERHINSVAFLVGFIFDNITLRRIDLWLDNIILLSYLAIAIASIAVFSIHDAGRLQYAPVKKYALWLPLVIQFTFGNLFSGFVVFYWRSGSFAASWPFLFLLLFLFIGNEFFKERYWRFGFQVSILFFALFSYAIFSVPVILKKMGDAVFFLSGMVSIGIITLILFLISRVIPNRISQRKRMLIASIGTIYVMFNLLYFTNVLPPIPLSLKDGGIYHFVTHSSSGRYTLIGEDIPWYLFFRAYNPTFHRTNAARVYAFSAVFAPTKLNTTIFHRWAYFDKKQGKWIVTDNMRFPIVGGRDGGYRGYSFKQNVFPGKWRVDVVNARGQLLGRMKFSVVQVSSLPALNEAIQ